MIITKGDEERNMLEKYLETLKNSSDGSYIELDKDKEIQYMYSHKYRFEKIFRMIPNTSDSLRILDIGTTPFTFFLKETFPHYQISTLDRTNLLAERCRLKGIDLKVCDLDEVLIPYPDEAFDLVIFSEVLEHIFAPPSELLLEVKRILAKDGTLILGVPNIATILNRIKLLFGITPLDHPDALFKKGWVHGHGHIHEYTMKEIGSIVESCGFKIGKKMFISPKPWDSDSFNLFVLMYYPATILISCRK